ncbi:MAG: hypothetical protein Q9169_006327 [Polycauliona sp. 2 TL-2023]
MRVPCSTILFVSLSSLGVLADFLGPTYPYPADLTSEKSLVSAAWKNVTTTLEAYIQDPSPELTGTAGLKNLTFSLGIFSLHDAAAADSLQYHYTAAEVANSTVGITNVDGDSIYRTASITKLLTAYLGEIILDAEDWDRPITDFVPSLAEYAQENPGEDDPVNTIQWEQVTLVALASHMAGAPRDVSPLDPSDISLTAAVSGEDPVTTYGLPPLDPSDPIAIPPCANTTEVNCPANEYAKGAQARPPTFLPWTSPQYTDFGFMLLGLAISNITNKNISDVYNDTIFTPLNMSSSSLRPPPDNTTWNKIVIPGDVANGLLTPEVTPEIAFPSGGVFSTTNDLAKWGIALLNSTLLPPEQTRRWMKPTSFTANLQYAVGRPWEIYRYVHEPSGLVTDIYTKSGDSGAYGAYIVLLPDFNAGFSGLTTSSLPERGLVTPLLADIVAEAVIPALLAQAEMEAKANFAGTYTASDDEGLNSTVTVELNCTDGAKPGLVLTSFVSNGTDVIATGIFGGRKPIRLLPTIQDEGTGRVAFRTSPVRSGTGVPGLFSGLLGEAFDWVAGDSGTYGGLALGLFVFELGEGGRAESVEAKGWRVTLEREE